MYTVMQSMQVAHEIQEDHRRRATTWRVARRAHRRARRQGADAASNVLFVRPTANRLAPVICLRIVPTRPVTSVA